VIPLKDTIPSSTYPFVNYCLIVVNSAVFLYELLLGPGLEQFIQRFGVIPYYFTLSFQPGIGLKEYVGLTCLPLVTSLFIHGGWFHIIGNMWFLYIFGDNIEDRLGHIRYLFFYLFCGVAASLGHVMINLDSIIPTIGASGAIAGVLGAYALLYPWARVKTLIIIIFIIDIVELPAVFFLVFWFIIQLFNGFGSIMSSSGHGGVAWFAHIAGFVSGLVVIHFFAGRRRKQRKPPRLVRHEVYPWH